MPFMRGLPRFRLDMPHAGRGVPTAREQPLAERAIRPLAVGHGNWLHLGGDDGLKTASVLLGICASATRYHLRLWMCLRHGLDRLAVRSAGDDRGDLRPDAWSKTHGEMRPRAG